MCNTGFLKPYCFVTHTPRIENHCILTLAFVCSASAGLCCPHIYPSTAVAACTSCCTHNTRGLRTIISVDAGHICRRSTVWHTIYNQCTCAISCPHSKFAARPRARPHARYPAQQPCLGKQARIHTHGHTLNVILSAAVVFSPSGNFFFRIPGPMITCQTGQPWYVSFHCSFRFNID